MISLLTVFVLLVAHFVGDFLLQSDAMAVNKSKSNLWLGVHVSVYTIVLTAVVPLIIPHTILALGWLVFNGKLHFMTDYFTSRWTSKLYAKGDRHWFFVVIGLDQLIHYFCLIGSAWVLTGY